VNVDATMMMDVLRFTSSFYRSLLELPVNRWWHEWYCPSFASRWVFADVK